MSTFNADRINVGPVTRNSKGQIAVDFPAGDTDGVGLDIGASPAATNEKALIKLGSHYIGQDSSGNFSVTDANGTAIATLTGLDTEQALSVNAELQYNIPLIVAPSGSIGNNGALTSGTANPLTYLKTYTWFPTNSISASTPAGWYYTVWTNTTAATIYNNTWDGISEPTVPATPVAFVTTGPGAFTGPTAEAVYFTLPQAAAGVNSAYELEIRTHQTNNANAKSLKVRFSVIGGTVLSTMTLTSFLFAKARTVLQLLGVADKQETHFERFTTAAYLQDAPVLTSETTSAAFAFAVTVTKADATDVVVIEYVKLTKTR